MADLHTSSTSSSNASGSDSSSSEQEVAVGTSFNGEKPSLMYVHSFLPCPFCLRPYSHTDTAYCSYGVSGANM